MLILSWFVLRARDLDVGPWVACSIALRLSSCRLDQRLPATAPSTPPIAAPVPALPPVTEPIAAPAATPAPAPIAVPFWRSLMSAQPALSRAAAARPHNA